ncbi:MULTISPECIES: ribonuclease HI [Halobacterium]|uniref:ribonuclease HI n=1 Tax=Halobacterium TaxID=2239 RepID=UPI00196501EF|nr:MULTISPECIES: ribonuclease HI [Halobacterium]MCF2208046.1 ribonuclease HI family protein [Halobacterium salinarum]MCF2237891.1 ribonuclease HI family protein [Halobacterium salinarum]MDL0120175.1 ribonuclease HI [Halobacterium salinarum]MDL0123581.1 ribonuclease HI [Halobacterium salinarum]MDL0128934.1 ribonuclease HI [Halobacterium salinarum]
MPVVECDIQTARAALADAGASFSDGNSEHELWHADLGDAHAVAYADKLVVQGGSPTDITAVVQPDRGGRVHAYFDGASRGNPGPAAVGWVLVSGAGGIVAEGGDTIGRATNNQAEYDALIAALEAAADFGFDDIELRGDSQLVEKQLTGAWDTNDPDLRRKRVRARELLTGFDDWSITHVPRATNERADALANEALDDA